MNEEYFCWNEFIKNDKERLERIKQRIAAFVKGDDHDTPGRALEILGGPDGGCGESPWKQSDRELYKQWARRSGK